MTPRKSYLAISDHRIKFRRLICPTKSGIPPFQFKPVSHWLSQKLKEGVLKKFETYPPWN